MSNGGMSKTRLARMHDVMAGYVERGEMPGLVTMVGRRGEAHVDAIGTKALGASDPMRRDTIFRIASMSKPITAVAAMILVEECKLRLDEPVDELLPELANRKVLRRLEAPLDDVAPAKRAITLRDLLTFRMGFGAVMAWPPAYPIQKAVEAAGLTPGPNPVELTPDDYMKRLGALPLMHQPGEQWMYHTGSDVLGVLIARASGQSFADFLRERIFAPLGMKDTDFHVAAAKRERLATSYMRDPATNKLNVHDDPRASRWGKPPLFTSGGGGLVSTAVDYLVFCQMMLGKGLYGRVRILSPASVALMTMDHLTGAQKEGAEIFFGDGDGGFKSGWGFGMGVDTRRVDLFSVPGRFGWIGGIGTAGYSDPQEDLIGILLTQRMMESPVPPRVMTDFWTLVYQAIEE
jgi:CubicO group peptidase (beta-lactamase class C family)